MDLTESMEPNVQVNIAWKPSWNNQIQYDNKMDDNDQYYPKQIFTSIHLSNLLSHLEWLRYLIYYQVMWSPYQSNNNKKRNPIVNLFGFIFAVVGISIYIYYTFEDYYADKTLPTIMTSISIFCAAVARIISFHYLFSPTKRAENDELALYANYPWREQNKLVLKQTKNSVTSYIQKHSKYLNNRLKFYVFIGYALFIGYTGFPVQASTTYLIPNPERLILDDLTSFFGIYIPFIVFQVIWSVIAFNCQWRLYYLKCCLISQDTIPNFESIWNEYHLLHKYFDSEYKIWNRYMMLMFGFYLTNLWYCIDIIIDRKETDYYNNLLQGKHWLLWGFIITGVCAFALPLIEYTVSSANLNSEYNGFVKALFHYDNMIQTEPYLSTPVKRKKTLTHIYKRKESKINWHSLDGLERIIRANNDIQFLRRYIPQYPILVKLFGWELHALTPIKFIIVFAVARFISYSLYDFYK